MAGRPKKESFIRKKGIVERYLVEKCDNNRKMLTEHGIFQRLAEYAQSLGKELKAYDFSNDSEIRAYISALALNEPSVCSSEAGLPVFVPLDLITVKNANPEKQERMLRNREDYYRKIHELASKSLVERELLEKQLQDKDRLIQELRTKLAESDSMIQNVKREAKEAQTQNQDLRRLIRRTIEPERADELIQLVTTREGAIDYSRQYILKPIENSSSAKSSLPSRDFQKHLDNVRGRDK